MITIGKGEAEMHDAIRVLQPELDRSDRSDIHGVWIRRFGLLMLLSVTVIALFNVLGQRATTATVRGGEATLSVHGPTRVRAGLLYQDKITVLARQDIADASLQLSSGWLDGLTQNTSEPSVASETSGPDGSLILRLGQVRAGQSVTQYLDYQVNPTSFSSRRQTVTLRGGGDALLSLQRTVTIIP